MHTIPDTPCRVLAWTQSFAGLLVGQYVEVVLPSGIGKDPAKSTLDFLLISPLTKAGVGFELYSYYTFLK